LHFTSCYFGVSELPASPFMTANEKKAAGKIHGGFAG
jgi:hypothetical protein